MCRLWRTRTRATGAPAEAGAPVAFRTCRGRYSPGTSLRNAPVVAVRVDSDAAARRLGGIHGRIGAAQQRARLRAVGGSRGDTDARSHVHGLPVDGERML